MARARVIVDHAQLTAVFQSAAVQWAEDAGRRVVNAAKERAPVDNGRLRSSISATLELTPGTCILRVGSDVPYARYVEEGTGIYGPAGRRITPTRRQALKFPTPRSWGTGGRQADRGFVFRRSVAGSPPNPFLADALEEIFGAAVQRRPR